MHTLIQIPGMSDSSIYWNGFRFTRFTSATAYYCPEDVDRALKNAREVNPKARAKVYHPS